MNHSITLVASATVAVTLVMALIFVPSSGIATMIQGQQPTSSQLSSAVGYSHDHSLSIDNLNLQMGSTFAAISPQQAYAEMSGGAHVVKMNLVAIEKTIAMPSGISGADGCSNSAAETTSCLPTQVIAYTFNGTIPAPTIRAQQGDIIAARITDPASNGDAHGIDNHASIVSAANFLPTPPGTTKTYFFVATRPGVFEYHCEGNVNDLAEHVFRGMHGMVVVDPKDGYSGYTLPTNSTGKLVEEHVSPLAKEVKLDFSEYYLANDPNGDFDWKKMYEHSATYSYINGIPFGYQSLSLNPATGNLPTPTNAMPLHFKVGDHVRFFVLNSGDLPNNFHIVGGMLDRVMQGGMEEDGVQTFNIGGSNSAIIDVKFDNPGLYVALNHDYSQLFKGQFAVIMVDNNSTTPNPSNAVPPMGAQSISQPTAMYSFGTPLVWNGHSNLTGTVQSPTGSVDTTN